MGKDYETSGFSFTLSGKSDTTLLYEDIELKKKWDAVYKTDREMENEKIFAQCAITGEEEPIARIHGKIKGVYGGLATGSVLIGLIIIQKALMGMNNPIIAIFQKKL